MIIPDQISPLIAYRTWRWDSLGLKSLNNVQWTPGEAIKATCQREAVEDMFGQKHKHSAPHDGCSCGIYAAKNRKHLHDIGYIESGDIHGEVYLWGKVWDHKFGYRAEYAYPKNLSVCGYSMPFLFKDLMERIQPLFLYNVDISLTEKRYVGEEQISVPLYKKDIGVVPDGLEWLAVQRSKWYLYKNNTNMVEGDRVSIADSGLGIVKHIDNVGGDVSILLFNRVIYRVKRKDIEWSHQNNRWETFVKGYQCKV